MQSLNPLTLNSKKKNLYFCYSLEFKPKSCISFITGRLNIASLEHRGEFLKVTTSNFLIYYLFYRKEIEFVQFNQPHQKNDTENLYSLYIGIVTSILSILLF